MIWHLLYNTVTKSFKIGENKMKKLCSSLLVICLLFSLSACGKDNSAQDVDTSSSIIQNQTDITDISSTEQNSDASSLITDDSGSNDFDIPNSTTSTLTTTTNPTSTSKPTITTHTHSYSKATCTSPAKCSCGAPKGSALGHFYENWICIRCGKTNPSKPTFNPVVEYP